MLRAHILILQYLKKRSPWIYEFHYQKEARLSNYALSGVYDYLTTKYDIPLQDFPPMELLAKSLWCKQWQQIPTSKKHLYDVQSIILHDIKNISKSLFSALDVTHTAPQKPLRKPVLDSQMHPKTENENDSNSDDSVSINPDNISKKMAAGGSDTE